MDVGADKAPFNVLLTTYTLFERDSEGNKLDRAFLKLWRWSCLLLDEAHALKNRSAKRTTQLNRSGSYKLPHISNRVTAVRSACKRIRQQQAFSTCMKTACEHWHVTAIPQLQLCFSCSGVQVSVPHMKGYAEASDDIMMYLVSC